jgi:DNA-binding NarL/FixJ family response regulator
MPPSKTANPVNPAAPHIYLLGSSNLDRLAYRLLLRNELNLAVAVESDFSPTAVWAALRRKPELALVDADQASSDAVEAVRMILRLQPATRILIIGATVDPMDIRTWGRCKIHGYVVKDGGVDELRAACQAVLDGQQYYSEGIRNVVRRRSEPQPEGDRPQLSRRETELLPLLARGLTLREAAGRMTVSYKTADSYRTSLLRKLGLHDRVELARYAIREHIVDV